MKPKSKAHIFVSGVVQGVYFRDFTRSHANAIGLTGWVRNLPDGRVEAVVEPGEPVVLNRSDDIGGPNGYELRFSAEKLR